MSKSESSKTVRVSTETVIARIVKRAKPEELDPNSAAACKLGGVYRVIHGTIEIPREWSEWHSADGSEIPHASKWVTARMGDEVALGDEDAWRMLAFDREVDERHKFAVVEPLDTRPSRVGKVWEPPKAKGNNNGYAIGNSSLVGPKPPSRKAA